jgi:hypothetical protein
VTRASLKVIEYFFPAGTGVVFRLRPRCLQMLEHDAEKSVPVSRLREAQKKNTAAGNQTSAFMRQII